MKTVRSERGQALILIVFGMMALVSLTALAVDGGMTFADRRQAQNAADAAALAAALANVRGENAAAAALSRANGNGYANDGVASQVLVHNPPISGAYAGDREYFQVVITSNVETYFAPVIGIEQTTNTVQAVARAKPPTTGALFNGNAVVGLDPNGLSFDSWGTSEWYISGGGIFANYDARKKNNKDNIHFLTGDCVTVVHGALYFTCSPIRYSRPLQYPDDIIPMLPRIPACNGTAYRGGDGKLHPQAGADGSKVDHFEDAYAPGLYCITDAGGNIHGTVTGSGVTFYISDTSFTMKYNGGGAMAVQAPTSGEYAGVLMFSNITPTPCTQNLHFRGNGTADNVGTIFLPSACIDARGNSEPHNNRTQLIGYNVTANGTGDVYVSYEDDDNYKRPEPAAIELVE